jgi:hypothetical protein
MTLPESNRSSTVYYRHVSCCTLGKPSVTTGQRLSCHSGGAPRSNKMYVVWNTYQNFSVSVVGRTLRRGESQDRHWICSHWDMSPLRIVQFHSLVEMGLGYMERLGLQCLFVEYRTMCSLVEVLQKERVTLRNCKWLPMKICYTVLEENDWEPDRNQLQTVSHTEISRATRSNPDMLKIESTLSHPFYGIDHAVVRCPCDEPGRLDALRSPIISTLIIAFRHGMAIDSRIEAVTGLRREVIDWLS